MGPAGGAVWSTVTIHPDNQSSLRNTGNQYTPRRPKFPNAIVSLELSTVSSFGSYQATPGDIWTFGCPNLAECSDLDVDFGSTPMLFNRAQAVSRQSARDKRADGFTPWIQKAASLLWKTEVGPGGKLGGIEFGDATDGETCLRAVSAFPRSRVRVATLDGATVRSSGKQSHPITAQIFGPITVTGMGDNRLVFAGSNRNFIRALRREKMARFFGEFDTGGAVGGGPTVVDGCFTSVLR
jgi:hypothetical protein